MPFIQATSTVYTWSFRIHSCVSTTYSMPYSSANMETFLVMAAAWQDSTVWLPLLDIFLGSARRVKLSVKHPMWQEGSGVPCCCRWRPETWTSEAVLRGKVAGKVGENGAKFEFRYLGE